MWSRRKANQWTADNHLSFSLSPHELLHREINITQSNLYELYDSLSNQIQISFLPQGSVIKRLLMIIRVEGSGGGGYGNGTHSTRTNVI